MLARMVRSAFTAACDEIMTPLTETAPKLCSARYVDTDHGVRSELAIDAGSLPPEALDAREAFLQALAILMKHL